MSGYWSPSTACGIHRSQAERRKMIADLKFKWGKRLPALLQTEATECALACIAMILCYHGHETSIAEMRKAYAISLKGATLEYMVELVDQLGMTSRPLYDVALKDFSQLQLP